MPSLCRIPTAAAKLTRADVGFIRVPAAGDYTQTGVQWNKEGFPNPQHKQFLKVKAMHTGCCPRLPIALAAFASAIAECLFVCLRLRDRAHHNNA